MQLTSQSDGVGSVALHMPVGGWPADRSKAPVTHRLLLVRVCVCVK